MKSYFKLLPITFLVVAASCGNNNDQRNIDPNEPQEIVKDQPATSTTEATKIDGSIFNIESIPVSTSEMGDFPFFSFPEGLKATNKPIQRKYDIIYFPIDGKMTPIEGRAFKTNVSLEDRKNNSWSLPFFFQSYDDAILSAGGKKIFDGSITKEEYDRYKDQATYLGENGSIGYSKENIRVYVIRRADGKNIYIQLTGNTASGKLNILQEEGFKQTITLLKSDQIQKELEEKGKAILYINFDTDKSTLQSDGKEAVAEIFKVLSSNKSLKIAINGYTDNTGDGKHNQTLSEQRANTVLNSLVEAGIETSRLSAKGFGAQNPIADNSTEDGKAKNRRVELVKL